jgi:hypothetical protein
MGCRGYPEFRGGCVCSIAEAIGYLAMSNAAAFTLTPELLRVGWCSFPEAWCCIINATFVPPRLTTVRGRLVSLDAVSRPSEAHEHPARSHVNTDNADQRASVKLHVVIIGLAADCIPRQFRPSRPIVEPSTKPNGTSFSSGHKVSRSPSPSIFLRVPLNIQRPHNHLV